MHDGLGHNFNCLSVNYSLINIIKNYYEYNIKSNNQLFLTCTLKPSWHSHYMASVEQSNAAAFS